MVCQVSSSSLSPQTPNLNPSIFRKRLVPKDFDIPTAGQELLTVAAKKDPENPVVDPSEVEKLNSESAEKAEEKPPPATAAIEDSKR